MVSEEGFPQKAGELLGYIKKNNYSFAMTACLGSADNIIVGLANSAIDDEYAVACFFNSFERTKNAILYDVDEYLKINGEIILPDENGMHEIFSPSYDDRYYYLENIVMRAGGLWDQLAHICNIKYKLGVNVKRVDWELFSKTTEEQRTTYPFLQSIYDYIKCGDSFGGQNCFDFCKTTRNFLIHYSDYMGRKFYFKYIESKDTIAFFPVGYHFALEIFNILKCIEFAKTVFEEMVGE